MKKILLIILSLFSILSWAYTISGNIKNYSNRELSLKATDGIKFSEVSSTKTTSKGDFSFTVKDGLTGIFLIEFDQDKKTFLVIADGESITLQADFTVPNKVEFQPNSINDLYQKSVFYKEVPQKKQIMEYLKSIYKPQDKFYSDIIEEENFLDKVTTVDTAQTNQYPVLSSYLEAQDDFERFQVVQDELAAKAERKKIIDKLTNSGSWIESTGVLGDYVTSYLMLGNSIYKSKEDINTKLKSDLDELLNGVGAETNRGQLIMAKYLELLNAYNLIVTLEQYRKEIAELKCPVSSKLNNAVKALDLLKTGNKLEDVKLPIAEKTLYGIKSKYKVLLFWSPECPHCIHDFPNVKNSYKDLKEKGGELIAVSTAVNFEKYQEMTQDTKWINVYDKKDIISDQYYITGTPTYILVDAKNIIIGSYSTIAEVLTNMK